MLDEIRQQVGARDPAQGNFHALLIATNVLDGLKGEVDVIGSGLLGGLGIAAQDFLGDRKMLSQQLIANAKAPVKLMAIVKYVVSQELAENAHDVHQHDIMRRLVDQLLKIGIGGRLLAYLDVNYNRLKIR
jgi:hypothetical protein